MSDQLGVRLIWTVRLVVVSIKRVLTVFSRVALFVHDWPSRILKTKPSLQVNFHLFSHCCYLQVDLGKRKTITAIATQGNAVEYKDCRLKKYYLEYSDDASNWQEYTHKGQRKARPRYF